MHPQLDILSGARAGAVLFFTGSAVTVGRHPGSDLQFHPERDLAVSTHHALLFLKGGTWFVRDLASRNGTFVNGVRVAGDHPLASRDRITFGLGGAEVEFRLVHFATPSVEIALAGRPPGTSLEPRPGIPAPSPFLEGTAHPPASAAPSSTETTAERLRLSLAREARGLRWLAVGLSLLLLGVVVIFFSLGRSRQEGWDRERQALQARVDSILDASEQAMGALAGEVEGLGLALQEARREVMAARERLRMAGGGEAGGRGRSPDPGEVARLQQELQGATQALARFQMASAFDFRGVEAAVRRAVVRIYVERADGTVSTGTGFAVRPNATVVTNRHVLGGDGAPQPRRIALQFADSDQVWPARLLLVSPSADLALVKVDNIEGQVPVLERMNHRPDTLGSGTPVALLGFPLGGEPPAEGAGRPVIRPLLSVGLLEGVVGGEMRVQGYGAVGSSGSPVLDGSGALVGVVFGGEERPGGHTLLVVPTPTLRRFLDGLPEAPGE